MLECDTMGGRNKAAKLAALMSVVWTVPSLAETLSDTLADAYAANATILAGRFQQRSTDEQLAQAQSGWRPTVNVSGSIYRGHQYFGLGLPGAPTVENITPRLAGLVVDQPLYRGGGTDADIDRARSTIAAGADELAETEQTQLLLAATAYLDVYRDQGVVDLNEALIENLKLNQHDVQATYNAGAATETDTSQASARLEGAIASHLAAEAALKTSRSQFREFVGHDADKLEPPSVLGHVPATEDEATTTALARSPTVRNAREQLEAAKHQVDLAEAGLLPKVDGLLQLQHADDYLLKGVKQNQAEVGLQATVPLYEAGSVYAQVRAAHESERAAEASSVAAERAARRRVETAWNALQAARARQAAFHSQIDANDVALRDTGKEVTAGTRTRLDVLNAQQELFSSRVDLVGAEHDAIVATFQLEAAEGVFLPSALGLKVPDYDPKPHLDAVDGKWWGTAPATPPAP